jgi:hypothetical protein
VAGHAVVPACPVIERQGAVHHEVPGSRPIEVLAIRPQSQLFVVAWRKGDGAGIRVADGDRIGQELARPRIGLEGLPLADADGRKGAVELRVEQPGRLVLHHPVQLLEVAEVIAENGVELHTCRVDDTHGWRLAGQREGIDVEVPARRLHRRVDVPALDEEPEEQEVAVGRRADDEVAVGDRALVVGPHEEIAAALALVGADEADVRDVVHHPVHHGAQHAGRDHHHDRAVGDVQLGRPVNRRCVWGQE